MTDRAKTRKVLALVALAGFFILLGVLAFFPIPDSNRDPYNILLGALGGVVTTVVAFYFGDSEGPDERSTGDGNTR